MRLAGQKGSSADSSPGSSETSSPFLGSSCAIRLLMFVGNGGAKNAAIAKPSRRGAANLVTTLAGAVVGSSLASMAAIGAGGSAEKNTTPVMLISTSRISVCFYVGLHIHEFHILTNGRTREDGHGTDEIMLKIMHRSFYPTIES